MSGGDFFSRWSKRKRAVVRENPPATVPVGSEAVESEAAPLAGELSEGETLSPEELAKLPSLDSLTAQTDLTQFLRAGVPMVMRKAALRRMWSIDTNIRDYVSEAREYAYDWNAVGGVPGNGPLLPTDDIKAMLRDIFDGTPDLNVDPEQESEEATLIEAEELAEESEPVKTEETDRGSEEPRLTVVQVDEPSLALSPPRSAPVDTAMPRPRRHGSAIPL
ncbi:DUF3306 domain-containing protein [Methylobacterium sp.]|uniref:DUF3306 domain-containing protein n=1 Tax=Methylobacterium sp. TaxID=409 RepID=UPI003B0168C7